MRDYVILTDSACDISSEVLSEWGVRQKNLTYKFTGEAKQYENDEIPVLDFYQKMREGGVAKTAAVNVEGFTVLFEEVLKEGHDILYLGFSSGLSTTFNSARFAAAQLSESYPEAKILTVDSLAASAGFGLLVYLVKEKKLSGATIEEAAKYAEDIKLKICHWFTVDDLVYLKRGGRISSVAAFFGTVIGIKPVLHVDNAGKLINVSKVRGRKNSVIALADQYGKLAEDPEGGTVFISHADCQKDVDELTSILKTRYGVKVAHVTYIGPVIGAHSGPGTLALFFVGKER